MKKTIITILLILMVPLFLGCNTQTNPNPDYCDTIDTSGVYSCSKVLTGYFDTNISLRLYYKDTDDYDVEAVFEQFTETVETYHQYLDKYHSYDGITNVYTINHSEGILEIDPLLFDTIQYGIDYGNLVIKDDIPLFNIALHPVLAVWHQARNNSACTEDFSTLYCPLPTETIDNGAFNTDISDIVLNQENSTIEFLKPDMGIDLGGYAKGYVANKIQADLDQLEITYLLNLGMSNIITGGENPTRETGEYIIALEKPSTEFQLQTEYYQYVKIPEDKALVTSGINQRYFKDIETEKVYHHIIDPRTNYPGGEVMSVTIVYPDSGIADILSTSIFLLDFDDALAYVNATPDLEAVWYLLDGTIEYSNDFNPYIYELN